MIGQPTIVAIWILGLGLMLKQPETFGEEKLVPLFEVFLTNETSTAVTVTVEPVGFIFNDLLEYSLTSSASKTGAPNERITGDAVTVDAGKVQWGIVDHIGTTPQSGVERHIGYGRYKMTVTGGAASTWTFPIRITQSGMRTMVGHGICFLS